VTRDLSADPAWQEQDLGHPLPDSPHACSVCLPTWDSVIAYEEGREKVTKRLRAGYPRFFKHPTVERLFEDARKEVASKDEDIIVLPTRAAAHKAHRWVERRLKSAIRINCYHGLWVLVVPKEHGHLARDYWRFSGEVVSSRQAQDFLDGAGRIGSKSHLISRSLGKLYGVPAENTFVFASGMAAITAVVRSLPGNMAGKKTLQLEFPYVDCLKVQDIFGQGVVYLNEAVGESFDEALQRIRQGEFAAVFSEAPSNPLLRTVDFPRVAEACAAGSTPLVIDDSAVGPANVDALRFADVVTGSMTKWLSGAGDVMAGLVAIRDDSPFAATLIEALSEESTETAPLYVRDAEVLLSNLKEYSKRNEQVNQNGEALAAWLAEHPAVAQVWHPSITLRDNYDMVKRADGGYGGLLSFVLKTPKKTPKVYDALRVSKGPSFGTNFTIACPYTQLAHYHELEWAEACGVSPYLLRVSTGLEPVSQLLAVFEEALAHG
jgi:cystathionine gamma-synthase